MPALVVKSFTTDLLRHNSSILRAGGGHMRSVVKVDDLGNGGGVGVPPT